MIGRTLTDADVDAIAQRVVVLLADGDAIGDGPEWVDASELARRLGVGVDYVYSRRVELGGIALGDGPRPRLRFDAREATRRLTPREGSRGSVTPATSDVEPEAPNRRRRPSGARRELLPIRTPRGSK